MKRKLFNATALYGAMLLLLAASAFTACTKDYDDELRIQREIIENNEKELRETIDYYQTEVNNLIAQLKQAYENADAQQQIEIDAAKAKLTELAAALKTAESNISSLSSNYEAFKVAVEADFNLVKQQLQAIGIRIDGIDNRLKDAEAAIAEMEAFRRATEEKIERMKQSQEASAEAIKELEAQLQVITTAIQSLQDQHNALKDIVAEQDKNLRDKINGVDTNLRDKIDALSADLGLQITNMNTTLTSQISDILILVHTMGEKNQEKIDAVKVELNILIENTKIELTEALNEYKIEVNLKFDQIDSLIDDLSGSIMNFAEHLAEIDEAIAALQGRIQAVRWAPSEVNGMLLMAMNISFREAVKIQEEAYIVCSDPDIIAKITAPDSPYTIEVVANQLNTRAIVANPFNTPIVTAGVEANTLKIELEYTDIEAIYAKYGGSNIAWPESGYLTTGLQIALKISDGKGNIAMSDFVDVCITTYARPQ